jgi:hypothetical protein
MYEMQSFPSWPAGHGPNKEICFIMRRKDSQRATW